MQTLELVTFTSKEGVTQAQVIEANDKVMQEIKHFDGFVYRSLCFQKESKQWLDIVYWENALAAKNAQEKFMTLPCCQILMSLVDESSTSMLHADVLLDSPCSEMENCG